MTSELHRPVAVDRIGPSGLFLEIEANAGELAALTARMGLPGIGTLRCGFQLRRIAAGIIEADGQLHASLTQVCVVTLDEFPSELTESFRVHFVPDGQEEDEPEPDAVDQIPYGAGMIDLGEAAAEQLALALDPYPHKPGAELGDAAEETGPNPFGALAAFKPRP